MNCTENKNNKGQHSETLKRDHDFSSEDVFWRDYNRVIGLLSNKYSVIDTTVRIIIVQYLRINEPGNYYILTTNDKNRDSTVFDYIVKPRETINETIQKFNSLYNIGKDTISSMLLDFELWLRQKD
jgi:hypothetical protein